MKQASEEVLQMLSKRGYRLTKAREEVLKLIASAGAPFTVKEIANKAKSDEASVYRTIRLLLKEGLLLEVALREEKPRYELAFHHHHHAVCQSCGLIAHIHCNNEPRPPKKIPGFTKISDHELTFYGLCERCG